MLKLASALTLNAGTPCPPVIAITDLDRIDIATLIASLTRWRTHTTNTRIGVQLRQPTWSGRRLLDAAQHLIAALDPLRISLIVNDRIDIAIGVGARAIHLRAKSVEPDDVRALMPDAWISVAAHTCDDVARAAAKGVDAIVFSPVFEVAGKGPPVGLDGLRDAVVASKATPIIALGGIDHVRAEACFESGASAVAMIRGVLGPIPTTIER